MQAGCLIFILVVGSGSRLYPQRSSTITLTPTPSGWSFGHIQAVTEIQNDRLIALDDLEQLVVVIDWRNQRTAEIAQGGNGASDLGWLTRLLWWAGDSAIVLDGLNKRYAVLSTAGVARTLRVSSSLLPQFTDTLGRLYAVTPRGTAPGNSRSDTSLVIERWVEGSTAARDSIRFGSWRGQSPNRTSRKRVTPNPFPQEPRMAVSTSGLVATLEPPYTIRIGGATRAVPYTPVKLTEGHKAAWLMQASKERVVVTGRTGGEETMRRIAPIARVPSDWPAFLPAAIVESIRFDRSDRLWVQRYVAVNAAPEWDVFDGAGRLVMRVSVPSADRIVGFGRHTVYVAVRSAKGTESIARCDLPRSK
jgi:hypothetical protein